MEDRKYKIWHGLVILAGVCLLNLLVFSHVQHALGLWGLLLTEVFIAGAAIGGCVWSKAKISDMFPIKMISGTQAGGAFFIWLGAAIAAAGVNLLTAYFFPSAAGNADGINNFLSGGSLWLRIVCVAVFPAVCEEFLHRGYIYQGAKNIKYDWVRVIYMAALFGLFHVDIYRFLPTAILGGAFTYIFIRTNNIILPVLAHFLNNLLSVFAGYVTESASAQSVGGVIHWALGMGILALSGIPFVIGFALIRKSEKPLKKMWMAAAIIVCASVFLTGAVVSGVEMITGKVCDENFTLTLSGEKKGDSRPFEVVRTGTYTYDLKVNTAKHTLKLTITDSGGKKIQDLTNASGEYTSNGTIYLGAGVYQLSYELTPPEDDWLPGKAEFSIKIH